MTDTVTINGNDVSLAAAEALMDDDIREDLCALDDYYGSDQAYVDAYVAAHMAKHGEIFDVS